MEYSDEELIQQYLSGNERAMEMIFQRYKVQVFNYALRILTNRADAEDVAADVFLAIFSRKYTYQPEVKFITWIYTVVRNACIDRLRRRKRFSSLWSKKTENDYEPLDIIDEDALPAQGLEKEDQSKYIQIAMNKLPADQKEAIILREYQSLSYDQIAQILGCSLSNVKVLIFRGREQLRKELSSFLKEGF